MRTVKEVSLLTGVSVRTLHYYDKIGLLCPVKKEASGYRLYNDEDLERLQQILFFRELEFPLKEIKAILDSREFDKDKALKQQITLLKLKKERLEHLIDLASEITRIGVKKLDFKAFDTKQIDEYAKEAKETWGKTAAYKEFEKKSKDRTMENQQKINVEFMQVFSEFGQMMELDPKENKVQAQVKKLKDYITDHFYTCTDEILKGLGQMYTADERMKESIDKAGGEGTAEYVKKVIDFYFK